MSYRSGNMEVWVSDSDGSNSIQLTSFNGPKVTTPRWSPDGGRIAFDSDAEGEFDVWVIGANGGKAQRMTTHPANDGDPSWSRDGRWTASPKSLSVASSHGRAAGVEDPS